MLKKGVLSFLLIILVISIFQALNTAAIDIYIEAEDGTLNPPISAKTSGSTTYISTDQKWEGSAEYTFEVPESNYYLIQGKVIAPASDKNSFDVSLDNAMKTTWHILDYSANWEWRTMEVDQLEEICHPADTNSDGSINIIDLFNIASLFGETVDTTSNCNSPDVNNDNVIDIRDLVEAAGEFGVVKTHIYEEDKTIFYLRAGLHKLILYGREETLLDTIRITTSESPPDSPPVEEPPPIEEEPTPEPTAFLHVNPDSGSDSNDGSSTDPLRTVRKALELASPGTSIRLQTGTYHEQLETKKSGLTNQPIIIEPDTNALPVFDLEWGRNAIRFVHSNYVLRNLEIKNFNEGIRIENVENVIVENVHLHHGENECLRLRYFAKNNIIRNNKIHFCGAKTPTSRVSGGNGEGIYIGTAPEQRYKNNNQPDTSNNNIIENNEVYDVTEAIDVKEDSSFNIIRNNYLHHNDDENSGSINVRADDNEVYDNIAENNLGSGFRFGGDSGVDSPKYGSNHHYGINNILRGNVAKNNGVYGYKFMHGPQDADCTNTGSNNEKELYFFNNLEPFVSC